MEEPRSLLAAIRALSVCGGATTCPKALSESDIACLAEQEGLHLPRHPERSMLSEIAEEWLRDRATREVTGSPTGAPLVIDPSSVKALLEMSDIEIPSPEGLTALAGEVQQWVRMQARNILAFTESGTASAEQVQDAVLQALAS